MYCTLHVVFTRHCRSIKVYRVNYGPCVNDEPVSSGAVDCRMIARLCPDSVPCRLFRHITDVVNASKTFEVSDRTSRVRRRAVNAKNRSLLPNVDCGSCCDNGIPGQKGRCEYFPMKANNFC